ncbi:acyl-CoA synthetase-related protein [Amycolatopsis mediterranei S699]|nr:acyl-CoA synthetase-related protein [Amycolatopsis mediterranei S699]
MVFGHGRIISAPATLCEAFQRIATVEPDAVAIRTVGATQELSWRKLGEQVRFLAAGLAGLGVRRGDAVALMMANRIEFYPVDLAAQHLGAIPFSVYNTLAASQIGQLLRNSECTVVVCEERFVEIIRESGAPIEHVIVVDGQADHTLSLNDLCGRGAADTSFDFETAWRAVLPDNVLTLIYTSGTTGKPKGVEITHANVLAQAAGVAQVLDFRFGDRTTSYLPSAHIADRFLCLYAQEIFGTQITVVPDLNTISQALPDCRPTVWGAVPRVWAKLKQAIERSVDADPRREEIRHALEIGERRSELIQTGRPVDDDLAAEHAEVDATVLSGLRTALGLDQTRWAVCGAAPVAVETVKFFAALGVPICEGWGMSELSCFGAVSAPGTARFGAVGKLLPGLTAQHADDGELLVRGPT